MRERLKFPAPWLWEMPDQAGHDGGLAAGMVGKDGFVPGGGVDVRVNLCREDAFVPQHLLHNAEVGAVFSKMSGE